MVSVFLTHPEVVIDPSVPIESWGLTDAGRRRALAAVPSVRLPRSGRIVSSAERKAVETADLLARALGTTTTADALLGEIDRSATGYLEPAEFEEVVDAFFACPTESVRGWERAVDAQARIVGAVRRLAADSGELTIVSHGAVGALLLADLQRVPITRALDQPGMGSVFSFDATTWRAHGGWQRVPLDSDSDGDGRDRGLA
jgi:broad specificity phosphatase PhoE